MNGDTKVSTQDKGPSSALGRDLLLMVDFPPAARERLWSILGPCVSEKLPDGLDQQIQAFERAFELQPTALPRVLRACRLLVRGAALRGLDASAVQTDALALTGSDEPGRVLARGYDAARALVRRESMRSALVEHGPVLDGVDWRIDRVTGSNRRSDLQFSFAVLTLHYEQAGRPERLTVQVTPETLLELEAACRTIRGEPASSASTPEPSREQPSGSTNRPTTS
jgi:COMM domain